MPAHVSTSTRRGTPKGGARNDASQYDARRSCLRPHILSSSRGVTPLCTHTPRRDGNARAPRENQRHAVGAISGRGGSEGPRAEAGARGSPRASGRLVSVAVLRDGARTVRATCIRMQPPRAGDRAIARAPYTACCASHRSCCRSVMPGGGRAGSNDSSNAGLVLSPFGDGGSDEGSSSRDEPADDAADE